MNKGQYFYYAYGVEDVNENKNDSNIWELQYGNGKSPILFFKEDGVKLIKAIVPSKEREYLGMTDKKLGQHLEKYGITGLAGIIKGRGFIVKSTEMDYGYYDQLFQHISAITCQNTNGKILETDEYKPMDMKSSAIEL